MVPNKNARSAIKEHPAPIIPYWYWTLVAIRFILACIPQNGYIHPDEFFQTMEPITGDIMNVEAHRCWEFNSTFPLRTIALSHLTIGVPLIILRIIDILSRSFLMASLRTPYFILLFPRLFYCMLSLINDYCLYKICRLYGQNFRSRLLTLASSYIILVYSTRTFSNSLEMILSSLLIWLVADCMLKSDCIISHNEYLCSKYEKAKNIVEKVNIYKIKSSLPAHSLSKCVQMASVVAIGIFNRPTFIGFAIPPVFFWLIRGLGTKYIGFKDFHVRILCFILSMIPAICFLILVDSFYYGYLTTGEILYLDVSIQNFVVTPFNFLKYNLLSDNLAQHGLHSRWLHLMVNVPMLFNVLGMAAIVSILRICYRLGIGSYSSMPKVQSITGLMTFSLVAPVAILSIFPHQEPRFLIPVLFPVVFLFTNVLQKTDSDSAYTKKWKTYAFVIWCSCNIFLTVFFGFIHQGGVYSVANHFHSELRAKPRATTIHLVTSHMYDIPQSLLLAESTNTLRINRATNQKYYLSKQMFLYELGSKSLDTVLKRVKEIWKVNEVKSHHPFRLYLVVPSSLKSKLGQAWFKTNATSLALKEETQFYPHLSTEAFPYLPKSNDQTCFYEGHSLSDVSWKLDLTLTERLKCFVKQFSLTLYRVDLSAYLTIDKYSPEKKIQ